jgi:hypothetical protein
MLLRNKIRVAVIKAKYWIKNEKKKDKHSRIYKTAKFYLRSALFYIDYDEAIQRLDKIIFIYDDIEQHYGETDGHDIKINRFYNLNNKQLKLLLIHEALHFIIKKDGIHGISEEKEHKIMEEIDPELI